MYNFLSKNGQLVAFLVGVVLVGIFLAIATSGAGDYYFDTMEDSEIFKVDIFNFGIGAAIALTIVCVVLIILLGLFDVVTNIKGSIAGIIGVLVLLGVAGLFYTMSTGQVDHPTLAGSIEKLVESGAEAPSSSVLQWVGAGLRTGIFLTIAALVLMIVMPLISPLINRVK